MRALAAASMRFLDWQIRIRPLMRRAICLLLAVSCLVSFTGLPLPAGTVKDTSQPFPCQHHHCGCRNAAQCWKSCCCQSPAERLAWARKHGVTPPRDLIAAVAAGSASAPKSCCQAKASRARPADRGATVGGTAEGKEESLVSVIEAFRCQGVGFHWITAGAVLASPPPATLAIDMTPSDWVSASSISAVVTSSPPDPPPPRV